MGSHGAYFRNRNSTKNIQFPYLQYLGHFCLGIIYTRTDFGDIDETGIYQVQELQEEYRNAENKIGEREITTVKHLKSITSVIKDFDFFVAEKWEIASDRSGSHNTANIGSITLIEDIKKGNGIFAKLGEEWFDEYWMNYGIATMMKEGKSVVINKLKDYLEFKGADNKLINEIMTKRKKDIKPEE